MTADLRDGGYATRARDCENVDAKERLEGAAKYM